MKVEPPWGGWSVGASDETVRTLWKQQRRAAAECSFEGDQRAIELLTQITAVIDDNSTSRLARWKQEGHKRGPSARWVKSRMSAWVGAPCAVDPQEAVVSNAVEENQVASSLAERWNVGLFKLDGQGSMPLSTIAGHVPSFTQVQAPPAPRVVPPLEEIIFENLPPLPQLPEWSRNLILMYMPKGAPGLDGWWGDALQQASDDSLDALVDLLSAADAGHFPQFWAEARVVGIPKPGTMERRPLTILSVFYRLWARRLADHLNTWAAQWLPLGAFGARAQRSAADAIWEASTRIEAARLGLGAPSHILALDQAKCFDRLCLTPWNNYLSRLA
jgi:hypothetical protein